MRPWSPTSRLPEALLALPFALSIALAAPAVAQAPRSTTEIINYAGPDREQVLLEGAKAEGGELTVYSAMIVNQALKPLTEAFMAKYPDINVKYWRGDSEDIVQRVLAEMRANNLVADLVEGTSLGASLVRADASEQIWSPGLDAYPEAYRDPDKLWVATRVSYYCMAYNTDLVSKDEVPKTYEDLLDPKWKGQIAWRIGSESGTPLFITNLRTAWGEEKAEDYLKKLSEQDIVNFGAGSARTLVDRVIAGEYAMALNIFCHHPLISARDGAPVASQLMSPVPSTAATLLIPKGSHHPYAAALFTDFVVSEEGQKILLGADYFPANPAVAPSDLLAPIVPETAGETENFIRPETLIEDSARSDELYQKYFR